MVSPALITGGLGLIGSVAGGLLSSPGNQETKLQKKQRNVIDQILAGLQGQGNFANLFETDEAAFQKSFVDPAKALFQNQIAPQIQQNYIASGMQRGSGAQDALTRAGVDLDQLLNQSYMDYINNAQNRQQSALNAILGAGSGAPNTPSFGQNLGQSVAGYLGSDLFGQAAEGIGNYFGSSGGGFSGGVSQSQPTSNANTLFREGFIR